MQTAITITLAAICLLLLLDRYMVTRFMKIVDKEIDIVDVEASIEAIKGNSRDLQEIVERLEALVKRVSFERNMYLIKYLLKEGKKNGKEE